MIYRILNYLSNCNLHFAKRPKTNTPYTCTPLFLQIHTFFTKIMRTFVPSMKAGNEAGFAENYLSYTAHIPLIYRSSLKEPKTREKGAG